MTTDDFLINHAYRNVWCAPEQDRQHIFAPGRISPPVGARGTVDILWSRYNLPTQGDWYHVFQIGPIIFENLNLELEELSWTSCSYLMIKQKMVIDVYTEAGKMIPRENVYLFATPDGNLTVAVKAFKLLGDFGVDTVYMRFYSNAFFNREDNLDTEDGIEYRFMVPATNDNISTISRAYRDMVARRGFTYAFINGWKVQSINSSTVKKGDLVEIVRDSSIRNIQEFPVTELPVFLSELDEYQKYLIHQYDKADEIIDYYDDIDIFLIKRTNENVYQGVYYLKNALDSVRMLTHRDYSIPAPYVERLSALNEGWALASEMTVQLVVRNAGLSRTLMNEAHHIRELYKLDGEDFFNAMIGTEANVSVWQAHELEKSAYPAIMRAPRGTVTREMVEDAYGYNTISVLLADTPQVITSANNWIELPFGLRGQSTIYEYDINGLLLGWYDNVNVQWYIARNANCHYIEGYSGKGQRLTNTVYGADAALTDGVNYRCYTCPMVAGVPTGKWVDVTGDTTKYNVVGGKVVWAVNKKLVYTAVKFDDQFLTYNLDLDYPDGLLRFHLNVEEARVDGAIITTLNEIPVGVLELWLNGHSLIKYLDWIMVGEEICIFNKVYRNQEGTSNRITIRASGFCNSDMSPVEQEEYGFVEHGYLSRNNRWNLRDDKVIRVTAAGRLWSREELNWSEDNPGVMLGNVPNGAPYQVIEPVIPLRGATLEDTYAMRAIAQATDKEIEDYMTEKKGQPVIEGPNLIPEQHVLYSPFTGKIMHDLLDGYIKEEDINGQYDDMLIKQLCQPYEWLLDYEPTYMDLNFDYINVHPHELYAVFELGIYQYNFLRRVIRLYLKDKVNIAQFISIKPLGQ